MIGLWKELRGAEGGEGFQRGVIEALGLCMKAATWREDS
jgi:hypothetical protein